MSSSTQPQLPSISEIFASTDVDEGGPLAQAFSTLFEPSPVLFEFLVPSISALILRPDTPLTHRTYNALIDVSIQELEGWPHDRQAVFLGGHPRIGEVKALSALSASEQAAHATAPEVLNRLNALNYEYERRYPGLRYITFVNGRSRKMIMVEMEEVLGVGNGSIDVHTGDYHPVGSDGWVSEAKRALGDVNNIAKSRLAALGVDGDEEAGPAQ
ncbi:Oxo-4-hydroxy-4-carboxy-5-ureidoimidazoline decarboxylase [Gloeopeniophorella convolvens]|nr:Oxo-4-hydroxy-4-carboxy-5-ureidoimidazoline decarboxylase [Gloeopeniophorella convolvens]